MIVPASVYSQPTTSGNGCLDTHCRVSLDQPRDVYFAALSVVRHVRERDLRFAHHEVQRPASAAGSSGVCTTACPITDPGGHPAGLAPDVADGHACWVALSRAWSWRGSSNLA